MRLPILPFHHVNATLDIFLTLLEFKVFIDLLKMSLLRDGMRSGVIHQNMHSLTPPLEMLKNQEHQSNSLPTPESLVLPGDHVRRTVPLLQS